MRLLMLRTVLVATDLTPASDEALDTAHRLAEASGAHLHVTHVVAPEGRDEHEGDALESGTHLAEVETVARQAGMSPDRQRVHILEGDPAIEIATLAGRIGADLIVLGHHRDDGARDAGAPMGSTAYAVITTSSVPCLVVSRRLKLPLARALVATDFSEAARGALLVALSWASALRSRAAAHAEPRLVALHVDAGTADAAGARHDREALIQEMESLTHEAGDWAGVQVRGLTRAGADPATSIAECAREDEAELVVLGTRAVRGTNNGLGSVSDAVVRQVDVPVLLVPPAVWRNHARDLDAA